MSTSGAQHLGCVFDPIVEQAFVAVFQQKYSYNKYSYITISIYPLKFNLLSGYAMYFTCLSP